MPSAPPSELPDDVAALRAIIAAQGEELAAARAGLTVKTLEIEKLKEVAPDVRTVWRPS